MLRPCAVSGQSLDPCFLLANVQGQQHQASYPDIGSMLDHMDPMQSKLKAGRILKKYSSNRPSADPPRHISLYSSSKILGQGRGRTMCYRRFEILFRYWYQPRLDRYYDLGSACPANSESEAASQTEDRCDGHVPIRNIVRHDLCPNQTI